MRRAYLFTNHSPSEIVSGYSNIQPNDAVICVDKGLERVHGLGLKPDVLIGDLDSLSPDIFQKYPGLALIRYAAEKNETDTELALLWGLEQGFEELVICNDLQGRFDHALGLVQNLLLIKEKAPTVRTWIESQNQRVFILEQRTEFTEPKGSLLSLIALDEKAEFAYSKGLKYPLDGLTLYPHLSRGISNEIIAEKAVISLKTGVVLAIMSGV